jgi:hypothetical protein
MSTTIPINIGDEITHNQYSHLKGEVLEVFLNSKGYGPTPNKMEPFIRARWVAHYEGSEKTGSPYTATEPAENVRPAQLQYDPTQQGDLEEDI